MGDFINFLGNNLADFWTYTGFANATVGHVAVSYTHLDVYKRQLPNTTTVLY